MPIDYQRQSATSSIAEIPASGWITRLRKFITAPTAQTSRSQLIFWFTLSLTCAAMYGLLGLRAAFRGEYVVQDDAQQHVFWMLRFIDPELFPNDLIADYYQSVAQAGYKAIYQVAAAVGINPIFFSKLLPMILGLITTGYCFGVCLELLPVPVAGFIASSLLNQNLWLKDDLVSGTARAFMYPLFLAFLYYLLRRALLPCLITIVLQGLTYPSSVLICAGILIVRLLRWQGGKLQLSKQRSDYLFCVMGLGVAFLVLLPLALESSEFGPTVTAGEARSMLEFSEEGRSRFFVNNLREFWLYSDRSGLLPFEWSYLPYFYFPSLLGIGLSLPLLRRYPSQFPLVRQITSHFAVLPQLVLVSVGLFLAAHAVLFKLYLPSRYTQYSMRMFTALLAGITITIILDAIFQAFSQSNKFQFKGRQLSALALTTLLWFSIVSYPAVLKLQGYGFLSPSSYVVGEFPELYEFFLRQPKDTLIASLVPQTDELSSFTKRSVLVSREHAIPYHTGFYRQFRQRAIDLVSAQYSSDPKQVGEFIQKYGIDFWLVDRTRLLSAYVESGHPDYLSGQNLWIKQYAKAAGVPPQLKSREIPVVARTLRRCSVFGTQNLVVLQASCIANGSEE